MTKSRILYLFTRTPLHVGAGSSVGAIDQPIQRERHTGFPIIPGSALKGVLADGYLAEDRKARSEVGRRIFGHENPDDEHAKSGSVSFGEAKLLAFPVRSAKGCFAWITSRVALERWSRDSGVEISGITWPEAMEIWADGATLAHEKQIVLEEYQFDLRGPLACLERLQGLDSSFGLSHSFVLRHLSFVIVSRTWLWLTARPGVFVRQTPNPETGFV